MIKEKSKKGGSAAKKILSRLFHRVKYEIYNWVFWRLMIQVVGRAEEVPILSLLLWCSFPFDKFVLRIVDSFLLLELVLLSGITKYNICW